MDHPSGMPMGLCPACHVENPLTIPTCWKWGYDSFPDEPTEDPEAETED